MEDVDVVEFVVVVEVLLVDVEVVEVDVVVEVILVDVEAVDGGEVDVVVADTLSVTGHA